MLSTGKSVTERETTLIQLSLQVYHLCGAVLGLGVMASFHSLLLPGPVHSSAKRGSHLIVFVRLLSSMALLLVAL